MDEEFPVALTHPSVNPWTLRVDTPPFVHPWDEAYVDELHIQWQTFPEAEFHTEVPPNPFAGPRDASLLVLLANPGYDKRDSGEQTAAENLEAIIKSISSPTGSPAWPLTLQFAETMAGQWWRAHTRELMEVVGDYDTLAGRLLSVELHAYHSIKWRAPVCTLPTQYFNFHLVEEAMKRGAVIIVARAINSWLASVPRLRNYPRAIIGLSSSQSAHLTQRNLGRAFPIVARSLLNELPPMGQPFVAKSDDC